MSETNHKEELAELFRVTYERMHQDHNASPWGHLPTPDREVMVAVCNEILIKYNTREADEQELKLTQQWELLGRLTRDLKTAAKILGPKEARFLTDFYYQMQRDRIISANQVRIAGETGEPNRVLTWFAESTRRLEDDIRRALDSFSDEWKVGRWMKSICGIGPVLSSGFLSHLDIRDKPSCGHFWRFAGLDPTVEWEKGEKRPWNGRLKKLYFKLGDCFVKVQNNKNDVYGHIYARRREYEESLNNAKAYASQAEASLKKFNFGKNTEARAWYEQGKLPPARMLLRSMRYAVKMFLSHLHHIMWEDFYDVAPPYPYIFSKGGHDISHYVPPPNWPFSGGGKSLKEFFK